MIKELTANQRPVFDSFWNEHKEYFKARKIRKQDLKAVWLHGYKFGLFAGSGREKAQSVNVYHVFSKSDLESPHLLSFNPA